ncbi:MAG: hypothetical protein MK108_00565 [Mariniblastus sp.]|nr:hypothetical protein [Mariniblastus sp.]
MSNIKQVRWMILAIPAAMIFSVSAQAQFDNAAKWVPQSANTLVMVRTQEIFKSEIAQKQYWQAKKSQAFNAGASFLPPDTKRLLLGAQMDFEHMEPIWEVAVFEKAGDALNIVDVSERVKGNLDSIDGNPAIVLPNDAFLVKVNDSTLAAMTPANRQMTSRWVRSSKMGRMNLSPYLTQAVQFADDNADIIVAFDFHDVVSHKELKKRLETAGVCKDEDLDGVCDTLMTIQGITLGITVNDKITGAFKIDFKGSPATLAASGKDILLAALKRNGLMVDDFESWDMQVKPNELLMTGALTSEGMRQIGSLIEHPLVVDFAGSGGAGSGEPEVDMKTRSLQYFTSVAQLTHELDNRNYQSMATYAKWYDKYARQIDRLSVLNVDPAVVDYGQYVASSFRDIAGSLLDSNYQKNVDQQQFSDTEPYGYQWSGAYGSGYYGRWGRYSGKYNSNYNKNTRNRQIAGARANEAGENRAKAIVREIDAETSKVRNAMSKKYNTNF